MVYGIFTVLDFPGGSDGKAFAYNVGDPGSIPGSGNISWRRKWQPTPVVFLGFPGGSDGKECTYSAGDMGSIPGSEKCPGGRHGNPLQYFCLDNSMDKFSEPGGLQSMGSQRVRPD